TTDTYKLFFNDLLTSRQLVSFYDFVNTEGLFPHIHRTHPHFCLITLSRQPSAVPADFAFWNTNTKHLTETARHFKLSTDDILLLNPYTRTCPIFNSRRDAELVRGIHQNVQLLGRSGSPDTWQYEIFQKMIDATIHAKLIHFGESSPSRE